MTGSTTAEKETDGRSSGWRPDTMSTANANLSRAGRPLRENFQESPAVTGLRGLSALGVLLWHGGVGPNCGGAVYVDIFMVISGYVMMHSILSRERREPPGSPGTWIRFWTRRVFRIMPLWLLAIAVCFFIDPPAHVWPHLNPFWGFFPGTPDIHIWDWSLSLEVQFYAAFPLLFLAGRSSPVFLTCTAVGVGIAGSILFGVYGSHGLLCDYSRASILPLKITVFVAGMLIAFVHVGHLPRKALWIYLLACGLPYAYFHSWFVLVLIALFSLAPRLDKFWNRFLSMPFFLWLGSISYSVYVVHNFLFYAADQSHITGFWRLPLVVLATFLVAHLSFHFIERPGIRLGRELIRLSSRVPEAGGYASAPIAKE